MVLGYTIEDGQKRRFKVLLPRYFSIALLSNNLFAQQETSSEGP